MDKILPHSEEIEKIVIGTLMSDKYSYDKVSDILSPECFYNDFYKNIFTVISKIIDSGKSPDSITVYDELKKNNDSVNAYELMLISSNKTFEIEQHALMLKEKAIRRKFFEISDYLNTNCFSESEDIENVISRSSEMLENMLVSNSNSIVTIKDGLSEVYKNVDKNLSSENVITGLETGFRYFDKRSGGLQKTDFVIIAGETSQGKTSLALSILNNIAKNNHACAIYSLEMNLLQLASRFVAMESDVSSKDILFSKLQQSQIEKIDKSIGRIENTEIYIDESSTSCLSSIISSIRYLVLKHNVEVVVIDYLQLVKVKGLSGNKEQQTAYLARELKNLAKELKITIIALSQLSRNRDNPIPTLSRLRDSGQIEEAADIVMFVYRPEYYKKNYPEPFEDKETSCTSMIDIAKGRNIGVFSFLCGFKAETTHFFNLDIRDIPDMKFEKSKTVPF